MKKFNFKKTVEENKSELFTELVNKLNRLNKEEVELFTFFLLGKNKNNYEYMKHFEKNLEEFCKTHKK